MGARFDLVTFDSPDIERLAAFWSGSIDLLEVELEDGNRWIVLADGDDRRSLGLERGEQRVGTVHLDGACRAEESDGEVRRPLDLGVAGAVTAAPRAVRLDRQLADPTRPPSTSAPTAEGCFADYGVARGGRILELNAETRCSRSPSGRGQGSQLTSLRT